ncbi:MAG: efflux transporter outer membrane subunit [Deltaproteobacteria bacterium]|nr:efflux transporter outer membrane subunit [Deltaproteobacteria bacterium]
MHRKPVKKFAAWAVRCLGLLLLVLLSACAVGPDYQRPAVDTPDRWRISPGEATTIANVRWWMTFGDPRLNYLVETALKENLDLRKAAAVVQEYLALAGQARADYFPELNLAGKYTRARASQAALPEAQRQSVDPLSTEYQGTLTLSYEIDFWGRIRRANEAAQAQLLSSQEAQRATIITLVSSVVNSYIQLKELDLRLEISKRTVKSLEESLRIARARFKAGLISELDVRQAEGTLATTTATVPDLEKLLVQKENEISVLLGRYPEPVEVGLRLKDLIMPAVPAGLPSELLVRRPDILQAEQNLVAANAKIGLEKAEYFPKFTLTGALGNSSPELSSFFSGPASLWQLGLSVAAPIFNAGKIADKVEAAEARSKQAEYDYRKTALTAFKEVENALIGNRKTQEQVSAVTHQVKAQQQYLHIARLRYDNGQTSYLEVLDAQRQLFSAENDLAQAQSSRIQAMVELYKALGGGWWP